MSKRQGVILLSGALLGLGLKYAMLWQMGVFDMNAYYAWGKLTLEKGLPRTYHGIYFPLQYQLFEICAWMIARTGAEFFVIFKIANLLFDLGSFLLLFLLLTRKGANPTLALLYWLHPWFLAVFSLGYIDFQFAFLVLLSLWLQRSESGTDYLLAGLALGLAFLMKPQAQILVLAAFGYAGVRYLRRRDVKALLLLVGPILLFLAYEGYFIVSRPPRRPYFGALILPESYLNISNVMPALTAQMTNIWYPIAYLLKAPDQPLYAVSDQIEILPFLSLKYLAAITVLVLIGLHLWRIEGFDQISASGKLTRIFCFSSMIVPFVMTSGHENHLFLGTVLLVLLLADRGILLTKLAGSILLFVQFLHIYSLYGSYPVWLAALVRPTQSDELAIVYSLVSLACFGFIAKALWSEPVSNASSRG